MRETLKNSETVQISYLSGDFDACHGDSGGALLCRNRAGTQFIPAGIVSYGFGCGEKDIPGIYTKAKIYFYNFMVIIAK